MSQLLFHEAQQTATALADRLRVLIDALPTGSRQSAMTALDPRVHDTPSLVFTGQFNSGKSTLIKAITDGRVDPRIDSDVVTAKAESYDWDGFLTLVDTPGVQAGSGEHDEQAERALMRADLVLFAVTVELFDDALESHLQHVLGDLNKVGDVMVVITKASTMADTVGARPAAVARAAGPYVGQLDFVECDAFQYLESLDLPVDDPDKQDLRDESNIDDLRSRLNSMARLRGAAARLVQPFHNIIAVCGLIESDLSEDPTEKQALDVLARQERALVDRRSRLEASGKAAATDFRRRAVLAAEAFADAIDGLDDHESSTRSARVVDAEARLKRDLDAAANSFAADITDLVKRGMEDLTLEIEEIEASPNAMAILKLEVGVPNDLAVARPDVLLRDSDSPQPARREKADGTWLRSTQSVLKNVSEKWGAGGGLQKSSGTFGHDVVLKVGHKFGHKFRPWEAVKVADRLGNAMTVANKALPLVAFAAEAIGTSVQEDRRAKETVRRRNRLVRDIVVACDQIVDDSLLDLREAISTSLEPSLESLREARAAIRARQGARTAAQVERQAIEAEATSFLTTLA
jgi:hypothetical protein